MIAVISITMCRMYVFLSDAQQKQPMGRRGKKLSPEVKRRVINIFKSWNSITEIIRLFQRSHSTACSLMRRYLMHCEIEGYIIHDDNALVHRARLTVEYKTLNHIPSLSCHRIYIIGNLWLLIKGKLRTRKQTIYSSADLF